jgi:hypothetical protein
MTKYALTNPAFAAFTLDNRGRRGYKDFRNWRNPSTRPRGRVFIFGGRSSVSIMIDRATISFAAAGNGQVTERPLIDLPIASVRERPERGDPAEVD